MLDDLLDEAQLAEQPHLRETTQSRWVMLRDWLTRRSPLVVFLRVYCQVYRRITGAPAMRFSRITPQLYVGGQHWPHGLHRLRAEGLDSVVNLRSSVDDAAWGVALDHYLHLPTVDNTPLSHEDIDRGVAFITERIAAGGRVYVHCGVGVGRGPPRVAADLGSTGVAGGAAGAPSRRGRPVIGPNRRQLLIVRQYSRRIAQP